MTSRFATRPELPVFKWCEVVVRTLWVFATPAEVASDGGRDRYPHNA
jgi:hypothetical protein